MRKNRTVYAGFSTYIAQRVIRFLGRIYWKFKIVIFFVKKG